MIYLDHHLALIDDQLAGRNPERGGVLLSAGSSLIDEVILDRPERLPGPVWFLDEWITRELADRETRRPELRWMGTIHSHPGGFDRPSSQDVVAAVDMLRRNPSMGRAHLHIVTRWQDLPPGAHDALQPHELPLANGKVSCFVVHAARPENAASAIPQPVTVLPIFEHALALADAWEGEVTSLTTAPVSGQTWAVATVTSTARTARLWAPPGYPAAAPFVSVATDDGVEQPLALRWDHGTAGADRLVNAVRASVPEHAEHVGSFTDRTTGPLGGSVSGTRVVVFGLGSVGSVALDQLVRSGVDDIILIDPDDVEVTNLSRTVYRRSDVGRAKVDAALDHIRAVNPEVRSRVLHLRVQDLAADELRDLLDDVAVVIAATDDAEAQARINAAAFACDVPAVFIGLYAGAAAGEVVVTVPGATRCYRCAAPTRQHGDRPSTDYGTGRLAGEPALGCDIHRVVCMGTRVALGLLTLQLGADTALTRHLTDVLGAGEQFLITSTVPSWGLFGTLFADVPGQHGFGTAWMGVRGDPSCSVCGDDPQPLDQLLSAPSPTAMAAALRAVRTEDEPSEAGASIG